MDGDALDWDVVEPDRSRGAMPGDTHRREAMRLRALTELAGARGAVATAAATIFDEDRAADVELCTSELLTNAIEHGEGDHVVLEHAIEADRFVVSVSNGAQHPFSVPDGVAPHDAQTGRGLHIVRAVADDFSISNDDGTVVVSCSFRR